MEIIRIPKGESFARLELSRAWNGRIESVFTFQNAMSGFAQKGDYQTVRLAEEAAQLLAEQRLAAFIIIEDKT